MAILQQSYPFTTAGNYTYPASIEVTGGVAQLALADNAGQTFNQDFAVDTGFTYDSNLSEFAAGVVRQKDQLPTNGVLASTFSSSLNANYAISGISLTATQVGTPTIVGNKFVATGNNGVHYNDVNIGFSGAFAIKFKYTPDFNVQLPAATDLIALQPAGGNNDKIVVTLVTNSIRAIMYDNTGANIQAMAAINGAPGWVSGVEKEIEINVDPTAGTLTLFFDGVLHGTLSPGAWTRGTSATRLWIGANPYYGNGNGAYADVILFNAVQHTIDYVPGYTLSENRYANDVITLPTFNYSGLGNIQSFDNLVGTATNTPRFVVNNEYWNGSAWAASSDTWATASPLATILANLATLTVADSITFKIITNDSLTVQQSVDDLTLTYTGQIYNTSNPVIYPNSGVSTTEFSAFAATIIATGSDAIRFSLKIDGLNYWWDGGAWATSSGYAETNTAAEINAQITTLNAFISGEVICVPQIHIHSNDGSTTPQADLVTIDYRPLFQTAQLQGFVQAITGGNSDLTRITVELNVPMVRYNNDLLSGNAQTLTVSSGQYDFNLVETDNMVDPSDAVTGETTDIYYIFTIEGRRITKTVPQSVTTTDILSLPDYEETET